MSPNMEAWKQSVRAEVERYRAELIQAAIREGSRCRCPRNAPAEQHHPDCDEAKRP